VRRRHASEVAQAIVLNGVSNRDDALLSRPDRFGADLPMANSAYGELAGMLWLWRADTIAGCENSSSCSFICLSPRTGWQVRGLRSVGAESLLGPASNTASQSRPQACTEPVLPPIESSPALHAPGTCSPAVPSFKVCHSAASPVFSGSRKYRMLCSREHGHRLGPKGPKKDLIAADIAMKRCNPNRDCPPHRSGDSANSRRPDR
jgi:hypothetical protein